MIARRADDQHHEIVQPAEGRRVHQQDDQPDDERVSAVLEAAVRWLPSWSMRLELGFDEALQVPRALRENHGKPGAGERHVEQGPSGPPRVS
jgi:hypothetical protein